MSGQNFYRLKQIDLDGSYSYSNVILLENQTVNSVVLGVAPLPSSGIISVYLDLPQGGPLSFIITDVSGIELKKFSMKEQAGRTVSELNLNDLSEGVYFLRTELPGGVAAAVNKIVIE